VNQPGGYSFSTKKSRVFTWRGLEAGRKDKLFDTFESVEK
jgi:hypothetical protein